MEFRKRLTEEKLAEINEIIIQNNKHDDDNTPSDNSGSNLQKHDDTDNTNDRTHIIDVTCAPQNIAFPQDVNLLNETREKLEEIICTICYVYNLKRPRMYRKKARKDYLSLAKSKTLVEFGAKLDLSIENGLGRIGKISFEAYNESEVLVPTIENYYRSNGHYPERVLADKIYRNRINLSYCKEQGIRLAGPALGRPVKDTVTDKRTEYSTLIV